MRSAVSLGSRDNIIGLCYRLKRYTSGGTASHTLTTPAASRRPKQREVEGLLAVYFDQLVHFLPTSLPTSAM